MADGIASRFDGVAYSGDSERLLQSVLGTPSSTTRARPGIRPGGGLTVTVGGVPEAASVAPGGGIITDTTAGVGSWKFVIPATVSKNLAARPAAGQSRLDEVVARINTTTKEVEIAVITGTASAGTPSAPTIPAGNLWIAELVVPASGSVSVQKPGQRTVAAGGILPVASQAEQDALAVIYDGLVIYREDTDQVLARINGAWVPMLVDSGWQNLSLTGTTGWTITKARYRLTWPRVEIDMAITRAAGASTITGDSFGNYPDTNVATGGVPSAIWPTDDVELRGSRVNFFLAGFRLSPAGVLQVIYGGPSSAIVAGVSMYIRDSYVLG